MSAASLQGSTKPPAPYDGQSAAASSSSTNDLALISDRQLLTNPLFQTVPRRDKSLSALSHELIARYGQDGTVIDLDDVQVRASRRGGHQCPSPPRTRPLLRLRSASDGAAAAPAPTAPRV